MRNRTSIEKNFTTFSPAGYLDEYYSTVDYENMELLLFYHEIYKEHTKEELLLEFGGGPTIYALISACTKVAQIHFSDYLDSNLNEVKSWATNSSKSFNWDNFIKTTLELEQSRPATKEEIQVRKNLLQNKITQFKHCDAFKLPPIENTLFLYDIIQINFVPDSITSAKNEWITAINNITSLLKPGGTLVMTSLKKSLYYHLKDKVFPAVSIVEEDLYTILVSLGFTEPSIKLKSIIAKEYRGYEGMIFLTAKKA